MACFAAAADHRDDLVPVLDVHQVERHLRLAEAHEVSVTLDQAGNRELPREIDHLGRGPDVGLDVVVAPDRGDAIAANRDGLRLGHRRIDGDDLAVPQHQRGRLDRRRLVPEIPAIRAKTAARSFMTAENDSAYQR